MSLFHNLKKIHSIKSEVRVLYRAFQDERTPLFTRYMAVLLCGIYIVSPIDIAPDVLLLFGIVDDVMIIPMILWMLLPDAVMDDARKYIAHQEGKKPHSHHWMRWIF